MRGPRRVRNKGWGRGGLNDLLVVGFLLGKDPDAEVPVLVGLEGGRHQDVLPRGQLEAVEHLPQVDEGVRPLPRSVRQEEVLAQVDVGLSCELVKKREQVGVEGGKGSKHRPLHSSRQEAHSDSSASSEIKS